LKDGHSSPTSPSGSSPEFADSSSILGKVLQIVHTVYEAVAGIFPSILQAIGAVLDSIISTAKELYSGIRDQILAWYAIAVQFVEDHPGIFVVILLMMLSVLFWHFSRHIVTAVMVGLFILIFLPFFLLKAVVVGVLNLILRGWHARGPIKGMFPPLSGQKPHFMTETD